MISTQNLNLLLARRSLTNSILIVYRVTFVNLYTITLALSLNVSTPEIQLMTRDFTATLIKVFTAGRFYSY